MLPFPLQQPVVCQHLMLLGINNNVTLYECFTLWFNLPLNHAIANYFTLFQEMVI